MMGLSQIITTEVLLSQAQHVSLSQAKVPEITLFSVPCWSQIFYQVTA